MLILGFFSPENKLIELFILILLVMRRKVACWSFDYFNININMYEMHQERINLYFQGLKSNPELVLCSQLLPRTV